MAEQIIPGSYRAQEVERRDAQQPWTADFADGLNTTAAAAGLRRMADEAPALAGVETEQDLWNVPAHERVIAGVRALTGSYAGEDDYDKDEKFEELTKDIPYEYWDEIMAHGNLDSAFRARSRIVQDLERQRRMGLQNEGGLASLAGSLIDVDLPLMAFSGGAYGAAKASSVGLRLARAARLSPTAALRLGGATQGLNAGLQAGAVVGAADALWRETTAWQDVANMALQSMVLGSVLGGATKGDVRASAKAAHDEFLQRVATDDPILRTEINIEHMSQPSDTLLLTPEMQVAPGQNLDKSIGAAALDGTQGFVPETLHDTHGSVSAEMQAISAGAQQWRHSSGWDQRKFDADDEWWTKVAMNPYLNFSTSNYNTLYRSNSPVANFLAGQVFESPHGLGRGRATSAAMMENYHKRMARYIGKDLDNITYEWAKKHDQTWQGTGYHISEQGKATFNREVLLELNDRAMGRTQTSRDPEVRRAADQYELAGQEALAIGKGRDGQTPLDGFENLPDRRGYTPYRWDGGKIVQLVTDGVVSEDALVKALSDGYVGAGMARGTDAEIIAKAVLHRAKAKDAGMDMSVVSLLSGDGHQFLRETLKINGSTDFEIDAIMERLKGNQHEAGKESFAKRRNDIDMDAPVQTLDGSDLRIVDLFDHDMTTTWQRYVRQMSGSAALARVGITNRAQRKEFIQTLQAEQRRWGEDVMDSELLEAMFSHFDGGPVHGYFRGVRNEGVDPVVAGAKRLTNLSLLEKLGMSQLAETGASISQNGLVNWMKRGPMAKFNSELKARNKALLDDMSFIVGEIGKDQHLFKTHLNLDETVNTDKSGWAHGMQKFINNASYVQAYTSGFNHIRAFQQQTAALGMADKVMRTLKKSVDDNMPVDTGLLRRFQDDFGLMAEDITALQGLIRDGVVEFITEGGQTYVNRLNIDQWDATTADVFGSSITRNINQLVQRSMAGEQDAWMHNTAMSVLVHLKSFPLQALSKQFIRNMRHVDTQTMTTVLYGMATAALAVSLRDAIDGRDRGLRDTAVAAFNYSNMTGFVPMFADPLLTMVGLEDHRFNHFGPYHDWTPPLVSVLMNDMTRIPGALAASVAGEPDYYDKRALKAIPFAGTYFLSRAFD